MARLNQGETRPFVKQKRIAWIEMLLLLGE